MGNTALLGTSLTSLLSSQPCPLYTGEDLGGRDWGEEELGVAKHFAGDQPCWGCLCQGPFQSCDPSESNDRWRDS